MNTYEGDKIMDLIEAALEKEYSITTSAKQVIVTIEEV